MTISLPSRGASLERDTGPTFCRFSTPELMVDQFEPDQSSNDDNYVRPSDNYSGFLLKKIHDSAKQDQLGPEQRVPHILYFEESAGSASTSGKSIFASNISSSVTEMDFKAWETWYVALREISSSKNVQLHEALRDLDEVKDGALEEDFPVPSEVAVGSARRLLLEMYSISPRRFEVYPTPDGEIAIDAPSGFGHSVLLLCDSNGGALCMVNMEGAHRRARYSDAEKLPDGFVQEALEELKSKSS